MPHGEPLRDASTNAVADDASIVDPEHIHELDHAIGVRANADRPAEWTIAAPITEHVHHDHAMSGRHQGDDVAPEMSRGREAMKKDDRLTGAPRAGRVVIEPNATDVDELSAHRESYKDKGLPV